MIRIVVNGCAVLAPLWVIGPLMQKGMRHRFVLIAIFLIFLGLHYVIFATGFEPMGALLRAIGLSAMMMVFGYVWALAMKKHAADHAAQASDRVGD
ncbi:MAG: hypothetical protein LH481_09940 [Burkholderiales bacterium]|nr:hypothetical protein [Burkholderiales bacterium]